MTTKVAVTTTCDWCNTFIPDGTSPMSLWCEPVPGRGSARLHYCDINCLLAWVDHKIDEDCAKEIDGA